jgi:hypothetical protein
LLQEPTIWRIHPSIEVATTIIWWNKPIRTKSETQSINDASTDYESRRGQLTRARAHFRYHNPGFKSLQDMNWKDLIGLEGSE